MRLVIVQAHALPDDEGRDVLDAEQRLFTVATKRASTQPELERASFERTTLRIVVGIPLQAYVRVRDGLTPILEGRVAGRVE